MPNINYEALQQHFLQYFELFRDHADANMVAYAGFQQGKPTGMASSVESLYQFMLRIPDENATILNAGAGASSWVLRKYFPNVICTDDDGFYLREVQKICYIGELSTANFFAGIENVIAPVDYCYYDYGNIARMPNLSVACDLTKHLVYVDDADTRVDCKQYRTFVQNYAAEKGYKTYDCLEAIDEYGRWGIIIDKKPLHQQLPTVPPVGIAETSDTDNIPVLPNRWRLLIKYATRNRPSAAIAALNNIFETIGTSYNNFEIIVSVDSDDSQTITAVEGYIASDFTKPISIFSAPRISKIAAINRDIEKAEKWDWLINMSDDMVFVSTNWYESMINDFSLAFGNTTDFFAHYNDGFVGDKLPTMSIIGAAYYYRTGYIYHPGYKSVSCDAEAMYVAMMHGKHFYFGDSKIYFKHMHPANEYGKIADNLYNQNDSYAKADADFYHKRRLQYFGVKNPVIFPYTI